jgi:hypothetical protein
MASARMVALVAVALLLLGCISNTYVQKVEKGGDAELSFSMNMTKLMGIAALGGSFGNVTSVVNNTADLEKKMQEFCENRSKTDASTRCSYGYNTLSFSRHFSLAEGEYKFSTENLSGQDFRGKRYTFTLERLPNITAPLEKEMAGKSVSGQGISLSTGEIGLDFTDPQAKAEAEKAALMMSMKYVVEMPGAIVSAEGADSFSSGRAVFDVLKMMKAGKNIVVISEEKEYVAKEEKGVGGVPVQPPELPVSVPSLDQNFGLPEGDWVSCAAAALLIMVAVGVTLLGLLKMFDFSVRPREDMDTREERRAKIKLVDYVKQQLAAGHPPEEVRKALIEAGWPPEDVDAAIKVGTWYGGPLGMY